MYGAPLPHRLMRINAALVCPEVFLGVLGITGGALVFVAPEEKQLGPDERLSLQAGGRAIMRTGRMRNPKCLIRARNDICPICQRRVGIAADMDFFVEGASSSR